VLCLDQYGDIDANTGAQAMVLKVDMSPFVNAEAKKFQLFKLAPQDLPSWRTPNGVVERGRRVKAELDKHPGVRTVLAQLWAVPPGQLSPIFIKLSRGDAELLTWETLCNEQDKFVALDRRWPIGRISVPRSGYGRPPAAFREPIRMMVVISALGIHQQVKEWTLIHAEAENASALGLNIRLRVLCADPQTRTAVDQTIANGANWIEVAPIGTTPQRILQDIGKWSPNILHFFCHGVSSDDEQFIELATASDYLDNQATAGSVRIPTEQLVDLSGQLTNPWLLTLNCCSGGQAAGELQSIAHQVVAAGFPAAIAMLEPVNASDAHEFTRAFYSSLFTKLDNVRQRLNEKAVRVSFEWAEPLFDARTAISDLHAAGPKSSPEWAVPVLYVSGIEPMHFERPPNLGGAAALPVSEVSAGDFKLRARLVAEWLALIKETMTASQREAVMKEVLSNVPKNYWPTVDGTFPHA
jgi:hypothetical protein